MTTFEQKKTIAETTKKATEYVMSTSDKIALASFIIAFLTFLLTIIIIYFTNKQNRLSVKPILKIIPFDFESNVAIYIKNVGVGPLFRNKLTFTNGTITADSLIDLMPKSSTIKWSSFSKFPDFVIPVNEQEVLIELKGDKNDADFNAFKMEVRKALKDITINCEYSDIYISNFKIEPFSLDYTYSRHFKS